MEHFNKVCSHDNVIVALNADKEKYLNYETSTSGSTIGMYACIVMTVRNSISLEL